MINAGDGTSDRQAIGTAPTCSPVTSRPSMRIVGHPCRR